MSFAYPNASTIAEFRPNSLTLHFHGLHRQAQEAIQRNGASSFDRVHVETVAHELTHWSDQLSTVWGQEYLVRLFDAYAASVSRDEYLFFHTLELFDEQRRVMYPLYYHVVEGWDDNTHSVNVPWQIEFTAGHEFSADGKVNESRPIFFVAFGDNKTGRRIARQPISVGSLLETTATWSEFIATLDLLETLPSDEALIERGIWTRARNRRLYDRDLTIYSAPVHMLARFTATNDVLLAYERAAVLANAALNMTAPMFDRLIHPQSFRPFGARRAAFLRAGDRGYAFAALARHTNDIAPNLPPRDWLGQVFLRAGLPSVDQFFQSARTRLADLHPALPRRGPLDETRDYLLGVGRERFEQQRSHSFDDGTFDPLGPATELVPPMFDSEGELFSVSENILDPEKYDAEVMHAAELELNGFTRNFLQGARGLEM